MTIRWNWGTAMGVVYALFATATSSVVAFSMRERVDLVSTDYYEQAVNLDVRRRAEARAAALDTSFAITIDDEHRRVAVQFPAGVPIESGTITLYRPADAAKDRVVQIAPDASSAQTVSLSNLAAGRWVLQVSWRAAGADYYAERPLAIEVNR